jgi:hypothetical protein
MFRGNGYPLPPWVYVVCCPFRPRSDRFAVEAERQAQLERRHPGASESNRYICWDAAIECAKSVGAISRESAVYLRAGSSRGAPDQNPDDRKSRDSGRDA